MHAHVDGSTPAGPDRVSHSRPRVGVIVVAYNAARTLATVLDRLPAPFRDTVDCVLVSDDASGDDTYAIGMAYQEKDPLPLVVMRHPVNLGYGGNQRSGYKWAIERELDVVVLLHGDGQYAPEVIESLVAPIVDGSADAVLGSRMMVKGSARAGGMPLYKYAGNRTLSRFQNRMSGLDLTEWHSGYRAYRVDCLADLPLDTYSDGFRFDTEIILGLHHGRKRIVEVAIPTYYGDEICYVNGPKYAAQVTSDVLRYRIGQLGLGNGIAPPDGPPADYPIKLSPYASHARLLTMLARHIPDRVLDVGCADGSFGARMRALGHYVVGVDQHKHDGVAHRLDEFIEADLNAGLPPEVGDGYALIVAADVLEHVVEPAQLLHDIRQRLRPGGRIIVSVPNFAHWYPRTRVAAGLFDYDERGILDRTHVRFFTRRSVQRLIRAAGLRIVAADVVGTPYELLLSSSPRHESAFDRVGRADRVLAKRWPTMFGYQFVYELAAV